MIHSLDSIKKDLSCKTEKQFYTDYIVRSDNWYFEKYMQKTPNEVIHLLDDYRLIISDTFGVSFNSVMMVGSGKLGYSMSPTNPEDKEKTKLFSPFNDDERVRKVSDIDIAIISSDIFFEYWKKFRHSYKRSYESTYLYVYRELYRGYINEKNISIIAGCRKDWNEMAEKAKKRLHSDLYMKHDISFRIYRSWEDFEEYNIQNIQKVKREVCRA